MPKASLINILSLSYRNNKIWHINNDWPCLQLDDSCYPTGRAGLHSRATRMGGNNFAPGYDSTLQIYSYVDKGSRITFQYIILILLNFCGAGRGCKDLLTNQSAILNINNILGQQHYWYAEKYHRYTETHGWVTSAPHPMWSMLSNLGVILAPQKSLILCENFLKVLCNTPVNILADGSKESEYAKSLIQCGASALSRYVKFPKR